MVLPRTIVTICCLWSWRCSTSVDNPRAGRHPSTNARAIRSLRSWRRSPTRAGAIRSLRSWRRSPTIVPAAIGYLRRRRPTSAYIIDAVRRTRARRATPSELRHRDRLTGYALERLGDGPTVRIVELLIGVVMVRLVGVEVRKWRNSVRVWVELRGRVSRGGGCVADRVATDISGGIDARTTRAVCRQGNVRIMCVKFGPFDLLIC
jgi:hypothetical protein